MVGSGAVIGRQQVLSVGILGSMWSGYCQLFLSVELPHARSIVSL